MKVKKVSKEAVVVRCKNKFQADKLKEKITEDLREKYIIQTPKKRKLMIKMFYANKENSNNKQEFQKKIEYHNERREILMGKQ